MTLDDLKIFVAVCEQGSLSAVARSLGCTQPAVSQHISRLERALAVELLERSPTGVVPTRAGLELRDAAAEGLSALSSGLNRISELRGEPTGKLTVTTGGTSVRHFLKAPVVEFRRSNPKVTLSFVPANSTALCLELVRDGRADLALVTLEEAERGIDHRVYARQDLRLLVPGGDPLARRKQVDMKTLAERPYIGLSQRTVSHGIIEQSLKDSHISLQTNMTVDDFDTACVFVELGLGCTIVPAVHAFHFAESADVVAVRLIGSQYVPIGLATRRWSALTTPALEFVEQFRKELTRMSDIPGVEVFASPRQ